MLKTDAATLHQVGCSVRPLWFSSLSLSLYSLYLLSPLGRMCDVCISVCAVVCMYFVYKCWLKILKYFHQYTHVGIGLAVLPLGSAQGDCRRQGIGAII